MKHLFTLNRFFAKYKWRFLAGVLFVSLSNYFGILIPQRVRDALNYATDNIQTYKAANAGKGDLNIGEISGVLIEFALILVGFMLLKGLFMYLMRQTIIVVSRLIEYDMRKEIFDHLQALDLGFYKRNKTGDIMARISEDVNKVRNYLGPAMLYGINLVSLFALTIFAMFQVSTTLTLYALAPMPFLALSIYYVSSRINLKSEEIQEQLAHLNSTAQEVYSGIRVVKSYNKEKQFVDYFAKESDDYKEKNMELAKIKAYFWPLMIFMISLSTILVVYIGGIEVSKGTITYGNIAEFVIYVNMLTWPVTAIGWIASIIQEAEASQKRINYLLDTRPAIGNNSSEDFKLQGALVFDQVSFTYPDTGIEALKEVSFSIAPGEKVAIVGRTASGKSTIADLILRMFDPTTGRITIDNKPLTDINLDQLRKQIGYVPQDVFLFSDTVANNVALGDRSADLETIRKYTEYAAVLDDVEALPQGFDTRIGERGVTLSGGQKQRLSIARALIKHPNFVIMDDALSAVDTRTEKRILSYLKQELADKTAIIITHRLSGILDFDKIIVLQDGRIVEQGRHEELLEKAGVYADLYEQQRLEEVGV